MPQVPQPSERPTLSTHRLHSRLMVGLLFHLEMLRNLNPPFFREAVLALSNVYSVSLGNVATQKKLGHNMKDSQESSKTERHDTF